MFVLTLMFGLMPSENQPLMYMYLKISLQIKSQISKQTSDYLSSGGGVYSPKCMVFEPFGLKTGIDFEHFGLKLGMIIGGMFTKAYKLIFLPSNQGDKLVREKEKKIKYIIPGKFYLFIFVTLTSVQH